MQPNAPSALRLHTYALRPTWARSRRGRAHMSVGALHGAMRRRMLTREEDWLVVATTDHGGTARACMPQAQREAFDADEGLQAGISQHAYEGVHGLDVSQHRTIFYLEACAASVTPGELLPAPGSGQGHERLIPAVLGHLRGPSDDAASPPEQMLNYRTETDSGSDDELFAFSFGPLCGCKEPFCLGTGAFALCKPCSSGPSMGTSPM